MIEPLALDLECRGYRGERWPFRIDLLTHALEHLIADAVRGHRVYELFAVKRPGDIWKYLWIGIVDVPDSVRGRCDHTREKSPARWPDAQIPFADFDSSFWGDGWDDAPEDIPWLLWRSSAASREFSETCFRRVKESQAALRVSDDIQAQHEIALLDRVKHEFDFLNVVPFQLTTSEYVSPANPRCDSGFYSRLQELLGRPEVTSLSYRGEYDHQLFRVICLEQHLRHKGGTSLEICALVNGQPSVTQWGADVTFMEEGLRWGELHVEHNNRLGTFSTVPRKGRTQGSRRLILLDRDEGEVSGYRRKIGSGWVLYERMPVEDGIIGNA